MRTRVSRCKDSGSPLAAKKVQGVSLKHFQRVGLSVARSRPRAPYARGWHQRNALSAQETETKRRGKMDALGGEWPLSKQLSGSSGKSFTP